MARGEASPLGNPRGDALEGILGNVEQTMFGEPRSPSIWHPYTIYLMKTIRTTVYLNAADYRKLKSLATDQGRSAAELVREAVAEYTARVTRRPWPRSIGIVDSGDPDFAANHEDHLADGRYVIERGEAGDLERALEIGRAHRDLSIGLVDGLVIAIAERLEARAIVTLDVRGVGGVALTGQPEIWPRDL